MSWENKEVALSFEAFKLNQSFCEGCLQFPSFAKIYSWKRIYPIKCLDFLYPYVKMLVIFRRPCTQSPGLGGLEALHARARRGGAHQLPLLWEDNCGQLRVWDSPLRNSFLQHIFPHLDHGGEEHYVTDPIIATVVWTRITSINHGSNKRNSPRGICSLLFFSRYSMYK